MQQPYTIHAARRHEKKKVSCASAREAVAERDKLLRQGWGVSISDQLGIPIADRRMDERAKGEAVTV